jgi:broad specificity phosphatase PhoE
VAIIYLRHGDDRGNDVYRHDRHLNERGREKAPKAAKRLIEQYGHPDTAYCSPFRRAIETLDAMTERFTRPVVVRFDRRVAQHLSEKQQRDPQVSPETTAQIAIAEDEDAFRLRIAAHVDEVKRQTGVVWCVTHQAVIEEVARHFGVEISNDLDFLDHVLMVR